MAEANIYRKMARAQGLPRFNTGQPCRHGHMSDRYTRSGNCIACLDACSKRWVTENPDKVKTRNSRWAKANGEKTVERIAKWRKANPERVKAHTERWRQSNIETCRERDRIRSGNRRAKMGGNNGTHTAADLTEIFAAQGGRCAYCRADLKRKKKHVDHIVPLAKGGSNGRSNLQYLCQPCNNSKSAKDPIDFARSRGLLI